MVAEELRAAGAEVDVRLAGGGADPAGYTAVIVGGPMIMGWHGDALRYVRRHRRRLAAMPTAYFITAMSLTETGTSEVETVPVFKDPWLAKSPGDVLKLRRKESYARPEHYLGVILRKTRPALPREVAFFGGALDFSKMNLLRAVVRDARRGRNARRRPQLEGHSRVGGRAAAAPLGLIHVGDVVAVALLKHA